LKMEKHNLRIELKELYGTTHKNGVVTVEVPTMSYLMADGIGNPNTSKQYKDAVEALFSVSYKIKFIIKKGDIAVDYGVMPLEGLWWMDNMKQFTVKNKAKWKWTAMIMQPQWVTQDLVDEGKGAAVKKKDLPAISKLRFEELDEGKCMQVLHTGPYVDEEPAIAGLHSTIEAEGLSLRGKHHEIYLNDMTRTASEKLKTIIRQPVQ